MVYSPLYTSATSIYTKAGLTSSQVDLTSNDYQLIRDADEEVELITNRKFVSTTSITEYFDGKKLDIVGYSGSKTTSFKTSFYPILSITSLELLDDDGTASVTYDGLTTVQISAGTFRTDDYVCETQIDPLTQSVILNGNIRFFSDEIPEGIQNIKITYTYGYSTLPPIINTLATTIGAIKMWITFLGGSYNRLDSYSIPQQSVNKGEFYGRGIRLIELYKKEIDDLLNRIGRRNRILVMSTGAIR